MAATGTLRVGRVVRGRLELHELVARARMQRGVLVLEEAQGRLYRGRVNASGTRVDLRGRTPTWRYRHASRASTWAR